MIRPGPFPAPGSLLQPRDANRRTTPIAAKVSQLA